MSDVDKRKPLVLRGSYQTWDSNFERVGSFIRENGKIPSLYSDDVNTRALASWCSVQRASERNGTLSREHRKKLDSISIWYWDKEEIWNETLERVKDYLKKNGIMPSKKNKDAEVDKLGQWCAMQRLFRRYGKLSEERQKKLESISIWNWGYEDKWNDYFNQVKDYVNENSELPSSGHEGAKVQVLGKWCCAQRSRKREGNLSKGRQKKLVSIKGWWWEVDCDEMWNSKFEQVEKYTKENGGFPSQYSDDSEVKSLFSWCQAQRTDLHNGELSEERQKKLESIPAWNWGHGEMWDSKFERVRNYAKKNGRIPKWSDKDTEAVKLSQWCIKQRLLRRNGKLSSQRQKKLESIPIWNWDYAYGCLERWESGADRVEDYVNENGELPSQYSDNLEIKRLGRWCSQQRYYRDDLSQKQQERLESISTWYWDRNDIWDFKFEQVKEYTNKSGKIPSSRSEDIKVKSLAGWCQTQRSHRRRARLPKEHQKKLESISIWYWDRCA